MSEITFQRDNIKWLCDQYNAGFKRLLIADETGLGKTYTAAGAIYELAKSEFDNCEKTKNGKAKGGKHFYVLYICSNQIIARKNMRELCDRIMELDTTGKLLTKKDAKKFSAKLGDRLSMPFKATDDSFIQLRNCTIETTFETYYGCGKKKYKQAELDEMNINNKTELEKLFGKGFKFVPNKVDGAKFAKMRKALIEKNVKPGSYDLVIIDEFQSYEQVLAKDFPPPQSDKDVSRVYIGDLFKNTRLLMLSATPYRMTDESEIKVKLEDLDESEIKVKLKVKLKDLGRIIKFLAGGSLIGRLSKVSICFEKYLDSLLDGKCIFNDLFEKKTAFETEFRKFCRRNQRLHVIGDNDFYIGPIYHNNSDYPESYKNEMPLMKEYDSIKKNAPNLDVFTASDVRLCSYPAAFSKGQERWNDRTYADSKYMGLFPSLAARVKINDPTSCEFVLDSTAQNSTANGCERIFDMCDVRFEKCSTRADCAEQLIDVMGNGAIFKCAWIPSSKARSLDYPFCKAGSNVSKLLVFSKHYMTCRWIAAYLSSKSFCKDGIAVCRARAAVENSDNVLKAHCECAAKQYLGDDTNNAAPTVAAIFARRLKEYFLREPVLHVLANAGVGSKMSFAHYANAGDLAAALEEYFFCIDLKRTLEGLDKNALRVQKYMAEHDITLELDGNGNIKDDIIIGLIKAMLKNAEEGRDELLLDGDYQASKETLCAIKTYVEICKYPTNDKKRIEKINKAKQQIPKNIPEEIKENFKSWEEYAATWFASTDSNTSIDNYRKMIKSFLGMEVDYDKNLISFNHCPINLIESTAKKIGSLFGLQDNSKQNITPGEVGILNHSYLSKLRDAILSPIGELELFPEQKVCVGFTDGNDVKCRRLPLGFACRFTTETQDSAESSVKGQEKVMEAFNTPFFPFVLVSTDNGKEGISFHRYCRRVLHLDPAVMPSDLIQRNGRIDRYRSLAIRQRAVTEAKDKTKTWDEIFKEARAKASKEDAKKCNNGMVPDWYIESDSGARIEEHVFVIPASRKKSETKKLYEDVGLYKQMIGSCLPEEMIKELSKRYPKEDLKKLTLNLINE